MSCDLAQSDIVLAGNSSVLVEAVTARPSVYVPGLDHGSHDLRKFVATGLIYSIADEPMGEHGQGHGCERYGTLDFEEMLRFYQRLQWSTVLPLFANIDEDATSVAARVGVAMSELAAKAR